MSNNNTGIIRVQKNRENPYVMINKNPLHDERLSWKAKGILAYLLSKPDNWKVIVGDLVKQSKDGEKAVYSGLKELKEYGYLEKYPVRIDGKIAYWESIVYEVPIEKELLPQNRQVDEPIENTDGYLLPQNGEVENVQVENRVHNNNDFNNNDSNDVVVEETDKEEELTLNLIKKINELNFKYKYTFSLDDIGSVLSTYSNDLDLIYNALDYMLCSEPKKGYINFIGFLIKAREYKDTPKEFRGESEAPTKREAQKEDTTNPHKTKFHLNKSRGTKYTADELEEMILARSKEKIEKYKK